MNKNKSHKPKNRGNLRDIAQELVEIIRAKIYSKAYNDGFNQGFKEGSKHTEASEVWDTLQ
jgi:hypothetical protein